MSDITAHSAIHPQPHDWSSRKAQRRLKRRYRRDKTIQAVGLGAIALAIIMLGILISSLISKGYNAFVQSMVTVEVTLPASGFNPDEPQKGNYRAALRNGFASYFPEVTSRRDKRKLFQIISSQGQYALRKDVIDNPGLIGTTFAFEVPLSDPYDQLYKNVIPKHIEALSVQEIRAFGLLENRGVVSVEDGRTMIAIDAYIDPNVIDRDDPASGSYRLAVQQGVRAYFYDRRKLNYQGILDRSAVEILKNHVVAHPDSVGQTIRISLPASQFFDQYHRTGSAEILNPRFSSEKEIAWYESLIERGVISTPFNTALFVNADSRFPEIAGLAGAIAGSFFALLVCFLISFPVAIAAAVYLEEFAPKNRWTDLIEVNINNLAAVPSVVFGLLGLAVFLGFFGLPRSAPLVGGMVLSLMTLPTIIIATRAALKAVPPSIREAALGIGASKHQVITHHVLPLAMPGILTGTIIGLAQALGETAPLLLIGMNAFIPSIESVGILEPATALPTQIFSWADSPERGFVARTSAAILVLLGFLVIMNGIAIYLRQKFQRRW